MTEPLQRSREGRRAADAGIALVEMMIASSLLGVAIVGIFGACISAISTLQMSSNHYHATCMARNRVQRALSLPFNTVPILAATEQVVDQHGNSTKNGAYTMTTQLDELSEHCYEVTVEVYYPLARTGGMSDIPVVIQSKIARGMHTEDIESP
jgi:Tfp pilus assembly protein PilV